MTDAAANVPPALAGPGTAHALALSVLETLDPGLRRFLLQTCVLDVLEPATCDRLLGQPGSQAVLDTLERRGVLTREAGEARRYRLPMVLQEALAAELIEAVGPAEARARYHRAAEILDAAGDWWGAVSAFTRAGDAEALERLARPRSASGGQQAESAGGHGRRQSALREARRARVAATATAPTFFVRLLGSFEVEGDQGPIDLSGLRPRVRALLQYLALHADAFVHRDVLAAVLWPEAEMETGRRGVQVAVSALRSVLQPGRPRQSTLLPRRGDAYALAVSAHGSSDVLDLETQLTRARRARAIGDVGTAIAAWREVARLYRGELLPEQGNAEWVVAERDRLRMAVAHALEFLGRSLADRAATDEAVEALRRALDLDPFRDGTWRLLAQTHEALGDVSAAAAARNRHRRMLADLGVLDESIDLRDVPAGARRRPGPPDLR